MQDRGFFSGSHLQGGGITSVGGITLLPQAEATEPARSGSGLRTSQVSLEKLSVL